MLDHLVGRPSPGWRRVELALLLLGGYRVAKYCHRYNFTSPFVAKWNRKLGKYSPLQIILFTFLTQHTARHLITLIGLGGPDPLSNLYSRNFYRASWIMTALDAGFWTAMPIKPKILRDFFSVLFSIIYLFFPNEADQKVRNFRATITVEAMRVSWEKQLNFFIRPITALTRPWFGVKRKILIPRPYNGYDEEPITAYLYYTGWAKDLPKCKSLVFYVPGGGFVTMSPPTHESHIAHWAKATGVPILAIDYKKAPEFPYPYAIEECFDAYRTIVESKGQCLGLNMLKESQIYCEGKQKHHTEMPIALVGDSAGGNIATAVMYKILEWHQPLPRPQGFVLIYPCLDFNISSWMTPNQVSLFRNQSVKSLTSLWEAKSHYKHKSPLSTVSDTERTWGGSRYLSLEEQVRTPSSTNLKDLARFYSTQAKPTDQLHALEETDAKDTNVLSPDTTDLITGQVPIRSKQSRLTMTSRMSFSNDRVLTPDLMRAMAILYLGPHTDPDFQHDYYLSPIVGPEHLLAQFPKTYLICGEKDPMVDDTILFAGRIRQAKLRAFKRQSNHPQTHQQPTQVKSPQAPLFALTPLQTTSTTTLTSKASKPSTFTVGDDESSSTESLSDSEPTLTNPPHIKFDGNLAVNDRNSLLPSVVSYARLYPMSSDQMHNNPNSANLTNNISNIVSPTSGQFGVEVKLLEGLSHAFLNMIPFLPEAVGSTKFIASWFDDIFKVNLELQPEESAGEK